MKDIEFIFLDLEDDPMLGKLFSRLTSHERAVAACFLRENSHLKKDDLELKINRLFLDAEKPKHWKEISELLSNANSRFKR